MQSEHKLNLSRKFRSRQFEQLVGQDLVVAMLKNSLFLDHFFPVYLFSGNRGCGKTSTARIFAAAINCLNLPQFQKNPAKTIIPCLECVSCVSFYQGRHPDFIEVDAASHTGVDNVRDLIESSVLLPIMGRKKVYLIDEVHMLSKAACNALLKILEEPPATALFLLATTDPQKLIETVRSRCFQLFFGPVATDVLSNHLASICIQEGISYETDGLIRIVDESGGCVRDALNMVEQVRFSHDVITIDTVTAVLGYIPDQPLLDTVMLISAGNVVALLDHIVISKMSLYATEYTWRRLVELIRGLLWLKHGVNPPHIILTQEIQQCSANLSLDFLQNFLDQLYVHYDSFMRSTAQYIWLEALLLRLCYTLMHNHGSTDVAVVTSNVFKELPREVKNHGDLKPKSSVLNPVKKQIDIDPWVQFLNQVTTLLDDQMIGSLFSQGMYSGYDEIVKVVKVSFPADRIFFKELLEETKNLWMPLIQKIYGMETSLEFQFQEEKAPVIQKKMIQVVEKQSVQQPSLVKSSNKNTVDLSDLVIAPMLLEQFPGTIREVLED